MRDCLFACGMSFQQGSTIKRHPCYRQSKARVFFTSEGRSLKLLGKSVANIQLGDSEYLSQVVTSDIRLEMESLAWILSKHLCS